MNWRAVAWVSCDAVSGYVAVMLWRRVQEAAPRASTSGGQSGGWWSGVSKEEEEKREEEEDGEGEVVASVAMLPVDGAVDDGVFFLDMAAHAAKEVHDRQLGFVSLAF